MTVLHTLSLSFGMQVYPHSLHPTLSSFFLRRAPFTLGHSAVTTVRTSSAALRSHYLHRASWRKEIQSARAMEAEQRRVLAAELRTIGEGNDAGGTMAPPSPSKYSFDALMAQIEGLQENLAQRDAAAENASLRLRQREDSCSNSEAAMLIAHNETRGMLARLEKENQVLQAALHSLL